MATRTILTSLPVKDNNRQSVERHIEHLFARLRLDGVRFSVTEGAYGLWYDEGQCHADETVFAILMGEESAIHDALAEYGENARQLAVLAVPVRGNGRHVLARGQGRQAAEALARQHGGATLLPDGTAVSFDYTALVQGIDYGTVNV